MLELQHTLHQLVRLTWCWWLGFLCPILEGLGIGQGLLGLFQIVVLSPQTSHQERMEISPVPRSEGPVVPNSHWSLHCLPWATGMMPRPSLQTTGCQSGWGQWRALATMSGSQAALNTTQPILNYCCGKAQVAGSAGSCLPLLLWPGNLPDKGQGEAIPSGPPLLFWSLQHLPK